METVSLVYDISGVEITDDRRKQLSQLVNAALHDGELGHWAGCSYTSNELRVFITVVDNKSIALSLVSSAIRKHPLFSKMEIAR